MVGDPAQVNAQSVGESRSQAVLMQSTFVGGAVLPPESLAVELLNRAFSDRGVLWEHLPERGSYRCAMYLLRPEDLTPAFRDQPFLLVGGRDLPQVIGEDQVLDGLVAERQLVLGRLRRSGASESISEAPYLLTRVDDEGERMIEVGLELRTEWIPAPEAAERERERRSDELRFTCWANAVGGVLQQILSAFVAETSGTTENAEVRVRPGAAVGAELPIEFEVSCVNHAAREQVRELLERFGVEARSIPGSSELLLPDGRQEGIRSLIDQFVDGQGSFDFDRISLDRATDDDLSSHRPLPDLSKTAVGERTHLLGWVSGIPSGALVTYKMIEDKFRLSQEQALIALGMLAGERQLVEAAPGSGRFVRA